MTGGEGEEGRREEEGGEGRGREEEDKVKKMHLVYKRDFFITFVPGEAQSHVHSRRTKLHHLY